MDLTKDIESEVEVIGDELTQPKPNPGQEEI